MSKPVALVTGGGSGIGLAAVTHFISCGYRAVIVDLNEERGSQEAHKLGEDCLFIKCNIANYSEQAHAIKQAFTWGGNRLDVFVANAGIPDTGSIYRDGELDAEGLPKPIDLTVMDVNLNAVVQGVWVFRHFAKKNPTPGGKVVVTSSIVGLYPNYAIPLYAATKHALIGFVRSAAPVYAMENLTINAICPVMIATNIMPEQYRHLWDPAQMTPVSTALKAYDTFLGNDSMTGQTVELALDNLHFQQKPAYTNENARWMFREQKLWEQACEPLLPRPVGQNVKPELYEEFAKS